MNGEELKPKPFVGARWVDNPTRQSLASSRKRTRRGERGPGGNPGSLGETQLRSPGERVDEPRGISPEMMMIVGAVGVLLPPAALKRRKWPGAAVPPGWLTGARPHWGSTGTCEALAPPPEKLSGGTRVTNIQARVSASTRRVGAKHVLTGWN